MAPYKNDYGEKKWATVQDKKMQFIKWLLLKKTEPNSWEKWHLIKMSVAKKLSHTVQDK